MWDLAPNAKAGPPPGGPTKVLRHLLDRIFIHISQVGFINNPFDGHLLDGPMRNAELVGVLEESGTLRDGEHHGELVGLGLIN